MSDGHPKLGNHHPQRPWGGRGGPEATPPPQPQPRASSTHPNLREAEQSAAGAGLCPGRVTLAMCPQFPHPQSEARPAWPPPAGLWAGDSRPTAAGKLPPLPHSAPRRRPRPRGLPAIWETNASATRDMSAARP